ncbi:MAG: 3-hydroxyacyl-ACP dehydratase FabZ [Geminicoccaceae bacterium]|nr:3-hydroxyacyl-ACP dehydratase FabZ [Geminicoccaceae bacterium]
MSDPAFEPGTPLDDVEAQDITRMIPHRYPFLLVDRVTGIMAFERAVGIKGVTLNEPFFQGHFPGDPIMPGVLIIEAMAQTAAVLTVASRARAGEGDSVYFMAIDDARFRQPVRPGVLLELEVVKERQKLGIWRFSGKACIGGTLVAETKFTAKVLDA